MENEEYKAQYHAYLQQLVDEYIHGGGFDEFYTRTRSQIDNLVETDPTAFFTPMTSTRKQSKRSARSYSCAVSQSTVSWMDRYLRPGANSAIQTPSLTLHTLI